MSLQKLATKSPLHSPSASPSPDPSPPPPSPSSSPSPFPSRSPSSSSLTLNPRDSWQEFAISYTKTTHNVTETIHLWNKLRTSYTAQILHRRPKTPYLSFGRWVQQTFDDCSNEIITNMSKHEFESIYNSPAFKKRTRAEVEKISTRLSLTVWELFFYLGEKILKSHRTLIKLNKVCRKKKPSLSEILERLEDQLFQRYAAKGMMRAGGDISDMVSFTTADASSTCELLLKDDDIPSVGNKSDEQDLATGGGCPDLQSLANALDGCDGSDSGAHTTTNLTISRKRRRAVRTADVERQEDQEQFTSDPVRGDVDGNGDEPEEESDQNHHDNHEDQQFDRGEPEEGFNQNHHDDHEDQQFDSVEHIEIDRNPNRNCINRCTHSGTSESGRSIDTPERARNYRPEHDEMDYSFSSPPIALESGKSINTSQRARSHRPEHNEMDYLFFSSPTASISPSPITSTSSFLTTKTLLDNLHNDEGIRKLHIDLVTGNMSPSMRPVFTKESITNELEFLLPTPSITSSVVSTIPTNRGFRGIGEYKKRKREEEIQILAPYCHFIAKKQRVLYEEDDAAKRVLKVSMEFQTQLKVQKVATQEKKEEAVEKKKALECFEMKIKGLEMKIKGDVIYREMFERLWRDDVEEKRRMLEEDVRVMRELSDGAERAEEDVEGWVRRARELVRCIEGDLKVVEGLVGEMKGLCDDEVGFWGGLMESVGLLN